MSFLKEGAQYEGKLYPYSKSIQRSIESGFCDFVLSHFRTDDTMQISSKSTNWSLCFKLQQELSPSFVRKQRMKQIELFLVSYIFISDIPINPECHPWDRSILLNSSPGDACQNSATFCTVYTISLYSFFAAHHTKLCSYSRTFSKVLFKKKKKKDFD